MHKHVPTRACARFISIFIIIVIYYLYINLYLVFCYLIDNLNFNVQNGPMRACVHFISSFIIYIFIYC